MKTLITDYINKCDICLQSKYERSPYKIAFSDPLVAKRPFEVIHVDTQIFFQNTLGILQYLMARDWLILTNLDISSPIPKLEF